MKRLIDHHLECWRVSKRRKPLLLRGARQVGKTFAARKLARQFPHFVEINFEVRPDAASIFEDDLDPKRILRDLSLLTGKTIRPGETLLFLDEIQGVPAVLNALRYFFEEMPDLHVIAAGSLLDFTIEQVGMPVGRVDSLYLYPLSLIEFLCAIGEEGVVLGLVTHPVDQPLAKGVHERLLRLVALYLAIGGMPESVACWVESNDLSGCVHIHHSLVQAYRQDF